MKTKEHTTTTPPPKPTLATHPRNDNAPYLSILWVDSDGYAVTIHNNNQGHHAIAIAERVTT